ncbi:MAG: metal ABC transporter substrate-binding protein [Euryarchaeota archaeon]|nr:metal ABC transporter substrate-binding protein [Euryarchaeota archaeon]
MKKIGCIIALMILLSMVSTINAEEKKTVICTTTVIESFVEEIGREKVEVISLVQPGTCPAHFDITPGDVHNVSNASLIIYSGIEPWLDDLIKSSGNEDVKKVLTEGEWNTPEHIIEKMREIRDALSDVNPTNAEYYEKNAEEAIKKIKETGEEIQKDADSLNVKNKDVICMQWQKQFVEWMGFNVVATYGPPEKVSMKDINELTKKKAILVIDNLQSGTKLGSQIAAEIGARHVILTNFPNAIPKTETLDKMIQYNADQLFNAVKAQNPKETEESHILELILALIAVAALLTVLYTRKK